MATQRNNATATQATVQLYKSVIKDVVDNVKEAFLDDGAEEHVLNELKTLWENKVRASGTVDFDGGGSNPGAGAAGREPAMAPYPTGGHGAHMKKMSNIPGMQKAQPHPGVIQQTQGGMSQGAREANATLTQMHGISSPHLIRVPQAGGGVIMLQPGNVIPGGQVSLGGMQLVLPTQQAIPQPQMHQRQFVVTKQEAHQQHIDQTDGPGFIENVFPASFGPNVVEIANGKILRDPMKSSSSDSIEERERKRKVSRIDCDTPSSSSADFISSRPHSDGSAKKEGSGAVPQLDGASGVSDDEDSNLGDDDLLDVGDEVTEPVTEDQGPEEVDDGEPLNSDDDIQNSDEETDAMFEADSVVICQYDKVQRNKNKWKFILKDGVMNLNGKDYVFNKASGEAEW